MIQTKKNSDYSILIVDDQPKNIQILGSILLKESYHISYTQSGKSALNLVNNNDFDLILLDIMMPEMDGYEVCEKIKSNEKSKDIPVIFLTAKTDSNSIIKGLNLGAQDYVIKPFNALELLARVKTHLELKYKSEQLVKMNQTLEEKVEQRTSELVESNKKLEGANSRLITLDKAKSEFLSIISHELRTPLNGIYGFTDLLESTLRTTEQLEYVNELKIAARKLVRFSDTALLITELRADRYRMQSYPCSLNDIFETTFSEHSKTIENKNIEIVKMNNTDLIVIGDFELLQKCISNIVENAIGYSPQNGKITINAQKIDGNIVCEICDSGKGFSDEAIEKLFGFFSCDKVMHHSEGYGLGLAAVKLIMDAHESKVEIGKCAEGGAMVKLILKA